MRGVLSSIHHSSFRIHHYFRNPPPRQAFTTQTQREPEPGFIRRARALKPYDDKNGKRTSRIEDETMHQIPARILATVLCLCSFTHAATAQQPAAQQPKKTQARKAAEADPMAEVRR